MSDVAARIAEFVSYAKKLKGDEKGEAQVFCDRLFRGFGHAGYAEAGATLEERIKKGTGKGVNFADLVWKPRVLIEMKKGGAKLHLHYQQAFNYWLNATPNRPRYVVLCNFREFWIYDFDKQLHDPVDTIPLDDLPHRYTALNFLFPDDPAPLFGNDREEVSRLAAAKVANLFRTLVGRGIPREEAQRFVLQLVVAMFAEDIDMMPAGTTIRLVNECLEGHQSSYDVFAGLFRQMNNKKLATAGKYKNIPYFNGGLFSQVDPIELTKAELLLIGEKEKGAAWENWSKVKFIADYATNLLSHAPYAPSQQAEFRNWSKQFVNWLFNTNHISINYRMAYEGVDIRNLSPGTRGIVLLLLYLALDEGDDRPLIIDQPEENLDPKSVFTELVSLFKQAKQKRQVIIVTHNANLVVNTNADQVIIAECNARSGGGLPVIAYEAGGLEDINIRQKVCDILEGGEEAFKERARRLRVRLER